MPFALPSASYSQKIIISLLWQQKFIVMWHLFLIMFAHICAFLSMEQSTPYNNTDAARRIIQLAVSVRFRLQRTVTNGNSMLLFIFDLSMEFQLALMLQIPSCPSQVNVVQLPAFVVLVLSIFCYPGCEVWNDYQFLLLSCIISC